MTNEQTKDPETVVFTAPDGTTVTQRELDELDRRAAQYCVINHLFPNWE